MSIQSKPGSRRALLATLALRLSPALLFVSSIKLPAYVAADKLDPSWQQALGRLLAGRAQAGVDYVFPYGPLGSLLFVTYDRALFWLKYGWEIGVGLASVFLLTRIARRIAHPGLRLLFFLVVLAFLVQSEEMVNVCLVVSALLWIDGKREPRAVLIVAALYLAVMGLAKFTFLMLGTALVGVVTLHLVLERSYLRAVALPALHAGLLFTGWIATGQSPANIRAYLRGSIEMASGFSAGMGLPGSSGELALALIVCVLVAISLARLAVHPFPRPAAIAALSVVVLGMLLSFKHGFTRHNVHAAIFFRFALIVPFLLPVVAPSAKWRSNAARALLTSTSCLAAIGVFTVLLSVATPRYVVLHVPRVVKTGVGGLLGPVRVRKRLEDELALARREFELPAIRAHVGGRSVDLLSSGLGVVFLNDLRWNPRPVFQSYTAYTGALLRLNAAHFESERAPEHVLLNLEPIDGRLLTHEDSAALLNILHAYRPALSEGPYVLLDRVEDGSPRVAGRELSRRRVAWGEEVTLENPEGRYQTLALDIRHSWSGEVRNFFLRAPAVFIDIRTDDGASARYRLIPDMSREEFLLNPLCDSQQELLDLYVEPPPSDRRRVVSFHLRTSGSHAAFHPSIEATIRSYADL